MTSSRFIILAIVAALCLFTGCAGPKQFKAPDSTAITTVQKELAASVATARAKVGSAARHVEAASSHQREAVVAISRAEVLTGEIAPKLADLRLRVTVELRPEVDALAVQVQMLSSIGAEAGKAIADTGTELALARDDIGGTIATLIKADRQATDINTKYGPEFLKGVERVTADANAEILKQASQSDREAKAKWMWFSAFLLTGGAFAAFAYLKR
jgi:outer membrane murein-binding lipoprotein Lpp